MVVNEFDDLDKLRSQIKFMPHNLFVLVVTSANKAVPSLFPCPFMEVTKQTFEDTNMYLYKVSCLIRSLISEILYLLNSRTVTLILETLS